MENRTAKNERLIFLKRKLEDIFSKYCEVKPFSIFKGKTDRDAFRIVQNLSSPHAHPQIHRDLRWPIFGKNVSYPKKLLAVPLSINSISTVLVSFILLHPTERFCNINFRKLMADNGVKISIGSACATTLKGSSHVLKEMVAPFIIRAGTIRFSLGDYNTENDLNRFEVIFKKIVDDL